MRKHQHHALLSQIEYLEKRFTLPQEVIFLTIYEGETQDEVIERHFAMHPAPPNALYPLIVFGRRFANTGVGA
jgi:hypothetical protein